MKLDKSFYLQDDPVQVARQLLGKILLTNLNGCVSGGIIVETEAYCGAIDRASHAYPNKKTGRNAVMFEDGGLSYVYMIYGIHHLFNVVTNRKGFADAVLIRALSPLEGVDHMMLRTNKLNNLRITSGPGLLSKAMGIDMRMYGESLIGNTIWIEEGGATLSDDQIFSTTRVGVDYAGQDRLLPWRFYIKENPWISKK